MKKGLFKYKSQAFYLPVIGIISIVFLGFVRFDLMDQTAVEQAGLMKQSVKLTERWFELVCNEKAKRNIISDSESIVKYGGLIGDDFTYTTTTLGSLEAKELATNPAFAAVITKYLLEAGIGKGSKVGVTTSGSFPSLAIATLASLQTLGADVVLMSSLGSSSYGSNQPGATWVDIENWLVNKGGLKYKTSILTLGAEDDNGTGLQEEGLETLMQSAKRNGVEFYIPGNLIESIEKKTKIFLSNNIKLFINIGGNQASMGSCVHSIGIPNGLNKGAEICDDNTRGILSRLAERGIPYLHLLNIKDLAVKNNIPLEPGITYGSTDGIYSEASVNELPVFFMLGVITVLLVSYKIKEQQ